MSRAGFDFRRHGGMMVVEVSGLFGPAEAAIAAARLGRELTKAHAVKVLFDLRRAVLLMAEDDGPLLAQHLRDVGVPVGLLVDPAQRAFAWGVWSEMVDEGRTAVPFLSPARASEWLAVPPESLRSTRLFLPVSQVGGQ